MTYQGRSLDDMPLAAYSTGTTDERDDEAVPETPRLSQQDAMALILGVDAAAAAAADTTPGAKHGRRRPRMPRPSLPRLGLPQLNGLSRAGADRPEATTAPAMAAAPSFAAATTYAAATDGLASASMATPSVAAPAMTAGLAENPTGSPGRWRGLGTGDLAANLRDPRRAVRDPRILAGGAVAIGVVLLGASLLGGGANPAGGPGAGASASAGAPGTVAATPGLATIELTGKVAGAYSLTGSTGFGRPTDGQVASTWTDATGSVLSLTGRSASVTRTTAAELVLSVTVVVDGRPVTFTSQAGECTVGMAEKVFNVIGSFVCPEVTSDDGKVRVKITGSYQT